MTILKKCRGVLALAALMLTGSMAVSAAETGEAAAVCYMQTLPGNWSAASEQTPEQEYLRSLTVTAFYDTENGELIPGLAQLPADVTAEYAGNETYGVPADAQRGYAFRIALREDVFWQDGTPVTADDVLFTLETLLESHSWIANAQGYLAGWEQPSDTVISLKDAGFDSVEAAQEAGYTRFYLDVAEFWGLEAGWESLDSRTRIVDYAMPAGLDEQYVTPAYLYRNYLAAGTSLSYLQSEFVGVAETKVLLAWENVGIVKTGTHEIIIVTEEPAAAQTVAARLADLCLLRQEAYGENYGSSPENYCSYGPYQIVSANGEEIRLERNEYWQGNLSDYPADVISCRPR